ncbi:helicase-related protein [Pseudolysinimonas sp.]|uniref:helicase-related protein n=1 Tax=Pseudolysinimonas sp. TaxID=2680009 RepID=UPI0037CBFF9E
MEHHVLAASDAAAKKDLVIALASGTGRRIMFTRTKHVAKRWARDLTAAGIPAADLHGNLSQGQRDRNLAEFAEGTTRVLVATDIAARGVHVDDVELVVHIDPPAEHKAYLHRSGRTARAGKEGVVVTLVLPEQQKDLAVMMRKAGIQAAVQPVTATSPAVRDLVGEVAAHVKPAPKAPAQPQRAAKPRQSSGGRTGQQIAGGQRQRDGQRSGSRQGGQTNPRQQRGGLAWSSEGGGATQQPRAGEGQQQRSGGQQPGGGGRRRRPSNGRPAAAGGGRGR